MINLGRHTAIGRTAFLLILLLRILQPNTVSAQGITPATDGTGTTVTPNGQSFDIESGSLSADGSNLFHSFQTFQLASENTANFLTNPSVQRIFARVSGGNTAFINGKLKISGGQADLFLLNPAGIIFGPDATLNLPASLTATTANHIEFNHGQFNATGIHSYGTLIGNPTAFAFGPSGTIHNQGDLTLLPGQSLTLLAGTVIKTGTLTADNIQIHEISEGQIIQVSQAGSLLSLELSGEAFQDNSVNGSLTMLPNLLTSGRAEHAGQIITNADGQILLADSSLPTALPGHALNPTNLFANHPPESSSLSTNLGDSSAHGDIYNREAPSHQTTTAVKPGENHRVPSQSRIATHHFHRTVLNTANASAALADVEDQRTQDFSNYFGRDLQAEQLTLPEIQHLLTQVHGETGNQSVVVYIKTPKLAIDIAQQTSTKLELLIFQSVGDPINLEISNVSQEELFTTVEQFRRALIASARTGSKRYLPSAQKLYQWLIQPIEDELSSDQIDTILFSMDSGLRSLPIAALHDGQQFLIEKYSLGMVPSLGLMRSNYQPLGNAQVLAMGASLFQELQPLPAVPAELENIEQLWPSRGFLNETFTRKNLIDQQQQTPAQIIHLATHAEFNAGNADQSYIQLWDEQLHLSDIHTLGWDQPTVDLLVLSACRTALGDANAEMGFAGLAVAAGVNSALASLWTVSDVGTLALMNEFYHQLQQTSVKSEALRASQLAMLKADIRIESGQLLSEASRSVVPLPAELSQLEHVDFSHPYYWSGFTMIGSPW
ncbi:filamentous hemagglutinin family N-terminal domain protein [Leptolyngbya sp. PCC 7375]|nr:filamentous hemagglutinin family N-terminal domain protein [Leptolyngbya sp. PCC 7375]